MKRKAQISEIISLEVYLGAPGSAPGNFDFIIVSQFADMDALNHYQAHPAHKAFGAFIHPLKTETGRVCIDYVMK